MKVIGVIEGSDRPTYLVRPLVSVVREHEHAQPEALGPVLTIDGTLPARSLPEFRSGITIGG